MSDKPYQRIVAHLEGCLARHGDTPRGVDWPRPEDVGTRYAVMLGVLRPSREGRPRTLLDFGCGASHLFEYLRRHPVEGLTYAGLDLSPRFVELSRAKYPENTYFCLDIMEPAAELPVFDYVVLNGVLTEKLDLTFDAMWAYARALLSAVFARARVGIAFNVMSKQVDWERDDLFHLPLDTLAGFVTRSLSRHLVIRHDYGLYEYTAYVYREPTPER